MKVLKLIMLFVIMTVSNLTVFADENNQKPIDVKPVKDTTGPHVPKTPSLLSISAYYDGNAVVITSTVDIMAHVTIFDSASGQTYYNNTVTIAPQYRCQIQQTDAMLTLQIKVDDKTYEGNFRL